MKNNQGGRVTIGTGNKKMRGTGLSGNPLLDEGAEGQEEDRREGQEEGFPGVQPVITISNNSSHVAFVGGEKELDILSASVREDGKGLNIDFGQGEDNEKAMRKLLKEQYGLEEGQGYTVTRSKNGDVHFKLAQDKFEQFVQDQTPDLAEEMGIDQNAERGEGLGIARILEQGLPRQGQNHRQDEATTGTGRGAAVKKALTEEVQKKGSQIAEKKEVHEERLAKIGQRTEDKKLAYAGSGLKETAAIGGGAVGAVGYSAWTGVKQGFSALGKLMQGDFTGALSAITIGMVKETWKAGITGFRAVHNYIGEKANSQEIKSDDRLLKRNEKALTGVERTSEAQLEKAVDTLEHARDSRKQQHDWKKVTGLLKESLKYEKKADKISEKNPEGAEFLRGLAQDSREEAEDILGYKKGSKYGERVTQQDIKDAKEEMKGFRDEKREDKKTLDNFEKAINKGGEATVDGTGSDKKSATKTPAYDKRQFSSLSSSGIKLSDASNVSKGSTPHHRDTTGRER